MQEQIVGFEVAKLAKYKEFDWEVKTYFDFKKFGIKPVEFFNKIDANNFSCWNFDLNKKVNAGYISAPTQALLQKWLREKHNIHIAIKTEYNGTFIITIYNMNKPQKANQNFYEYSAYEEALEDGLLKALKLIKNN